EDLPPLLGRCVESSEPAESVGLETRGQHVTVGDRVRGEYPGLLGATNLCREPLEGAVGGTEVPECVQRFVSFFFCRVAGGQVRGRVELGGREGTLGLIRSADGGVHRVVTGPRVSACAAGPGGVFSRDLLP